MTVSRAVLQIMTSNLPCAHGWIAPTKDHNLCLGNADGENFGCTKRLHGVQKIQTMKALR